MKIATFALALLLASPAARAGEETATQLFQRLRESFANIRDYTCRLESQTAGPRKTEHSVYRYYFKRPKLIRMEMVRGRKPGVIIIYAGGPKVRVKLPGALAVIPLSLGLTDRRIQDVRGHAPDHSDWGWFIDRQLQGTDGAALRRLGRETVGGRDATVYQLTTAQPDPQEKVAREKLWVDDKDTVLLKFELYDSSGTMVQQSVFTDIALNRGINTSLFINFAPVTEAELRKVDPPQMK